MVTTVSLFCNAGWVTTLIEAVNSAFSVPLNVSVQSFELLEGNGALGPLVRLAGDVGILFRETHHVLAAALAAIATLFQLVQAYPL